MATHLFAGPDLNSTELLVKTYTGWLETANGCPIGACTNSVLMGSSFYLFNYRAAMLAKFSKIVQNYDQ